MQGIAELSTAGVKYLLDQATEFLARAWRPHPGEIRIGDRNYA